MLGDGFQVSGARGKVGNREEGTGNREEGTGNGEEGTGNGEEGRVNSELLGSFFAPPAVRAIEEDRS